MNVIGTSAVCWVGIVGLAMVSGSCSSGGGGDGGTVADDVSVGLTTQGGATTVPSGGTLGIAAQVNNATNRDVTWALTGQSCPASCGNLTGVSSAGATYMAPANVTAQFTVVVTATSVQNPAKAASITLTVEARICGANAVLLQGPYAFLLKGFEIAGRNGIAAVGSFTADGCGNIVGGEADHHLGPTLAGHSIGLSGTYTVGDDRRGTINLTVGTLVKTFAVALGGISGGIARKGGLVEMGTPATTVMSGSLWRQEASAFTQGAINGTYAYLLDGWNGAGPREAIGGTVQANGMGQFTNGVLDGKRFGSAPLTGIAWTGSYATPSGSGRSGLTAAALTGASGTAVSYVVDARQVLVLVSDLTAPGRVLSGSMVAQAGPFGVGSMSGRSVAWQTANYDQAGYSMMTTSVLTMVSADGAGNLGLSVDVNAGGNIYSATAVYTYTVTPDGHAFIYAESGALGGKWYLTAPNRALMLGFDAGGSIGAILPQADRPFTNASISGAYFATQAPGGSFASAQVAGIATANGGGSLSAVLDVNTNGAALWAQAASGSLAVDAGGRATDADRDVIYVVSPTAFVTMSIDSANYYPAVTLFEQ